MEHEIHKYTEYAKGFEIPRSILADDVTEDDMRAALWYVHTENGRGG